MIIDRLPCHRRASAAPPAGRAVVIGVAMTALALSSPSRATESPQAPHLQRAALPIVNPTTAAAPAGAASATLPGPPGRAVACFTDPREMPYGTGYERRHAGLSMPASAAVLHGDAVCRHAGPGPLRPGPWLRKEKP